jgi:NADH dehydrogenase [ubiquinone] 1 alpha subcomplex assembly factor 7
LSGNLLRDEIIRTIEEHGPMSIADFMQRALYDCEHGFYMKGEPVGSRGAFTTAPEISQMFGELIGIWCAALWRETGSPPRFYLVEMGPGRGTLFADMQRATRVVPGFHAAAQNILIEISPNLERAQRELLGAKEIQARWHRTLDGVPGDAPLVVVGNEILDAMPFHQFVKCESGWHERVIAVEGGRLGWAISSDPVPEGMIAKELREAVPGSVVEKAPARNALVLDLSRRVSQQGGGALFIDYGYEGPALGDTLQAMQRHRFADALENPGDADLTSHVDFSAVAEMAQVNTECWGPVEQGLFLKRLGIHERAAALSHDKDEAAKAQIASELSRLTDASAMGSLFKVLAMARCGVDQVAGFEASERWEK